MANDCIDRLRDDNGTLPIYVWPGGYPIYYLDEGNNVLCPGCANKPDEYTWGLVAAGIHWEGEPITCDDCGCEIESAYGPVEDDNNDQETTC